MQFAQVTSFNLHVGRGAGGGGTSLDGDKTAEAVGNGGSRASGRPRLAHLASDAVEAAAGLLDALPSTLYLFVPSEESLVRRAVLHAAAVQKEEEDLSGHGESAAS